jgi:RNA polymerase sigma-70 factor (ECF subfamily)
MTAETNRPAPIPSRPEIAGPRESAAEELLERAGRGEGRAILDLYDRFAPSLMAVALRITGNRTEAEDVVQDTMTRAWRQALSFDRTRGSAVAWLVTLTRNRAIDVVRSRRRNEEFRVGEARVRPVPVETPEMEVSTAERARAVRKALHALNDDQRAVLDLAYFSGLSHSEIAAQLSQPLGTVKTRIAQAVRRLRDELHGVLFGVDSRDAR